MKCSQMLLERFQLLKKNFFPHCAWGLLSVASQPQQLPPPNLKYVPTPMTYDFVHVACGALFIPCHPYIWNTTILHDIK